MADDQVTTTEAPATVSPETRGRLARAVVGLYRTAVNSPERAQEILDSLAEVTLPESAAIPDAKFGEVMDGVVAEIQNASAPAEPNERPAPESPRERFTIEVPYAMPLNLAIQWGSYDEVDNRFRSASTRYVDFFEHPESPNGIVPVSFRILTMQEGVAPQGISTEDVLRTFTSGGLRPATLLEALAACAIHPHLQVVNPIVALGSMLVDGADGDKTYTPLLTGDNGKRALALAPLPAVWFARSTFLTVEL